MKIIAFGIAKEITGDLFTEFDAGPDPVSVAELKKLLFNQFPKLEKLATLSVAVNNTYAGNDVMIRGEDEVALIPPVSGG
ncbi:MoaD/ThiS family protein [Ferruginibacter paludis]|uniref:MoaD/ThiS family protein n=1 Tax=Ferruginibacter paludis TaxID=1310417 RepID=UPI0025B32C0D|nr:MoaD/ThiS family protein [Ferruginibacter paludis]MDN3656366.1 MoaD/ThiS family protein [Ferruginibacter paludis]